MQIEKIEFTQGEEGAYPERITAVMTVEEAMFMAQVVGKTRGGHPAPHGIYQALIGDVFNRYWEDGVDEALQHRHVPIPPIKYPDSSE